MSSTPIFAKLEAEFLTESKYCRLGHGPLVDRENFEQVEVVDPYFGDIGYVTRLIEVEEASEFLPMTDSVKDKEFELEMNGIEVASPRPGMKLRLENGEKLYVVEGAPELVDLDELETEGEIIFFDDPKPEVLAGPDIEWTALIPVIKSDTTETPDEPQEDVGEDIDTSESETEEEPAEEPAHVVPIRRHLKVVAMAAHKRISATGTLSWFISRAA